MKNNKYYEDWYEINKYHRNYLTEQEFAQSYNIGDFYRITYANDGTNDCWGTLFEEIKDAIKFSIQEQLADGIKVRDINLFKLNNNIKENENLKPLYFDG